MAEILLSLTIIGVVAAITLPSLTGNINERTWNTQRKALYARFSQAIALMPALNGYGTLTEESASGAGDGKDTATETFLTDGLAKVLKINNICDNEHLEDCGIVTSFTNMAGSQIDMPSTLYELNPLFETRYFYYQRYSAINTKAAAFETANGESILAFYNHSCRTNIIGHTYKTEKGEEIYNFPEETMCVNFIYDLNGNKGPNTLGKDIGIISVFNAVDPIAVAPVVSNISNTTASTEWENASKVCTTQDANNRLANIEELSSLLINKELFNLSDGTNLWSGSRYNTDRAWAIRIAPNDGRAFAEPKSSKCGVLCVKR